MDKYDYEAIYKFMFQDLPILAPYILYQLTQDSPKGYLAAKYLKTDILLEEIEFVIRLLQDNFDIKWAGEAYLEEINCPHCGSHYIRYMAIPRILHNADLQMNPPLDLSHYGDRRKLYLYNTWTWASFYEHCSHYIEYPGVVYCTGTTKLQDRVEALKSFNTFTLYDYQQIRHTVISILFTLFQNKKILGLDCFDFKECYWLLRTLHSLRIAHVFNPLPLLAIVSKRCMVIFFSHLIKYELHKLGLPPVLCDLLYQMLKGKFILTDDTLTKVNVSCFDPKTMEYINKRALSDIYYIKDWA